MRETDERHRDLLGAGQAALNGGDFARARMICAEIFAFAPGSLNGLWLYMMSGKITPGDGVFARIKAAAAQPGLPDSAASQLHFMLGKGYDDLGDHARAFAAFVKANRLKGGAYDPAATRRIAEALINRWRALPPDIAPPPEARPGTPRMIFVLGMPRSGTSLAAQMLGRHRDIANLGEQTVLGPALSSPDPVRFFDGLDAGRLATARSTYLAGIDAAGQGAPVLVDKMPENFWFGGLIPRLFPGATIVHMRRARLATCWSCFRNDFREGHGYANDFGHLLAQYDIHLALTEAARQIAGARWHEVALDDLTRAPRATLSPVLAQAGLGWDEACLTPEAGGASATLSKWQLRRGIDPALPLGWRAYLPFIEQTWGVTR